MITRLKNFPDKKIALFWFLYLLILLMALFAHKSDFFNSLNNRVLDRYWQWEHAHADKSSINDPVIIGIDEKFLEEIDEPIALAHHHLATLLYGLGKTAPRAVGIDMILPEKRFNTLTSTETAAIDYHRALLTALMSQETAFPLMITKTWDHQNNRFRDIMPDYRVALSMRNHPSGFVSSLFCPDLDGTIRHLPGTNCQPGSEPGLAESVFRGTDVGVTELDGLINFGEGPAWSYISLQTVIDWIEQNDIERLKKEFDGRIVLVGTTLNDTDLIKSPVSMINWPSTQYGMPGVLIHAQILRSLANKSVVREAPGILVGGLILLASFGWFGESSRRKFVAVFLCLLILPVTSLITLNAGSYWFPIMGATFMLVSSACLRGMYDGLNHYLTQRRLKSSFGGYVSPSVLAQITSGKISADRDGVNAYLCVLFSDIRGFTTLSEKYPPNVIVDILNRYFDKMASIVHKHDGTVDKFIGDGMMAFFGAPNPIQNPEQHAVAAAIEMREAMVEFNAEMVALGYPELAIGIGLHSGDAVVGNVGARQRHAYTAIGDTVNSASRLESLCKSVGYGLVCSGQVYRTIGSPAGWVSLGDQALKGRAAMEVYGWEQSRAS